MQFSKQADSRDRGRGGAYDADDIGDLGTALTSIQRFLNKGMYDVAVRVWKSKAIPFMDELRAQDSGDTWSTPEAAELAQTYRQLELRLEAQAPPYSNREEDRPPSNLHIQHVGGARFSHAPHSHRNPVLMTGDDVNDAPLPDISHQQRFQARPQEHPNPVLPLTPVHDSVRTGKGMAHKPRSAGVVGGGGHGLDSDHPLGGKRTHRQPQPPAQRTEAPFASHSPRASPLNPYARIPAGRTEAPYSQNNVRSNDRRSSHAGSVHSAHHSQSPLAAPSLPSSSRRSSHASHVSAPGLPSGSLAPNHASIAKSVVLDDTNPAVVAELSLIDGLNGAAVNMIAKISSIRGDVVESGELVLTIRNNGSGFRLIDRQTLSSYIQPIGGQDQNTVGSGPLFDVESITPTTCVIRYHPAKLFGSASSLAVKVEVIATGGKAPTPGIMLV